MAITTQFLGTLRRDPYVFIPVADTRYYLPKGNYRCLAVRSSGTVGLKASNGTTVSTGGDFVTTFHSDTKGPIEWVEFTGLIWRVLIAPASDVTSGQLFPPTTPQ